MIRRIRQTKADLIHIHLPNPTGVVAYLLSGHTGRLIVTYHSDIIRQRALGRIYQAVRCRALRRSKRVIATSPNYVDTSPVLSAYRGRCRVIPYGIPVEQFKECEAAQAAHLQRLYGPRFVIAVGRLVYYKGFEYLIRAMGRVRAKLLIVGDGPLRRSLERETATRGLADRVVFLGEMQSRDIVPYYHAADVFVLPSVARSEAFGIVQLEAMASGTPVVNTWLKSGVPFVSPNAQTGLTVPPEDPHALAEAINLLLDDDELRARCGAAARRRVRQEFSVESMVERTLQVYREALRSHDGHESLDNGRGVRHTWRAEQSPSPRGFARAFRTFRG